MDEPFALPAPELAARLVGARIIVGPCVGLITETEAYSPDDPASHSFPGRTRRNAAMWGPPGTAYVYLSYGMHWCLNVVGLPGHAALIRALEPLAGCALMQARRGRSHPLTLGPGMVAEALGISGDDNGRPFTAPDFQIAFGRPQRLLQGPRIGISRANEKPWRFGLAGSAFLSKPFPGQKLARPRPSPKTTDVKDVG